MKKTESPLYSVWTSMHSRCTNKNVAGYKNYGGRGIKVCKRWRKFEIFANDMGERPAGLSIDRINNDGDYKPSNCRWATHKEQQINKRPSIRLNRMKSKNEFVDRAIEKYGYKLSGLFCNSDGTPISKTTVQKWRYRFPPGRAIEWEKKIGDPRYLTAPTLYPPSEYRKRNGK